MSAQRRPSVSARPPRKTRARPVTARQRAVLDYINRAQEAPTLSEIAAALGLSRSSVHQHVQALRRKGALPPSKTPRRAGVRRGRPLRGLPTRDPASPKEAFYYVIAGLEHLMQRPLEDWEVNFVLRELGIALPALAHSDAARHREITV